jgi:outer membrane protein TolC
MELFLAEMVVVDAKRKRLPELSLSLGLGNMLLRTREGTASFVPFLGMSMPLVDMGDISRNIQKAELNSNVVKGNIETLARKLSGDTQRAASQVRHAFEVMQGMQKILATEQERAEMVAQLVQLRRADPLDEYKARMIADEMAVEYCQSVWTFRKAAIHLKETIGDPIIPL